MRFTGYLRLCGDRRAERSHPLGPHRNLKQPLTLACLSRAQHHQPLKGPGLEGQKESGCGVQCLAVCEADVHRAGLGGREGGRSTGRVLSGNTHPPCSVGVTKTVSGRCLPFHRSEKPVDCEGPRLMQDVAPPVGTGPQPCSECLLRSPASVLEVTALPLWPGVCPGPPCFPSPHLWGK